MKRTNLAYEIETGSEVVSIETEALIAAIQHSAEEAKGKDLVILEVGKDIGLTDKFVVVSGRSDRQAQGIANRIIEDLGKMGIDPQGIEGFDQGQWILLDFGDVVAHIFYEPTRRHYDLEGLTLQTEQPLRT